MADRRDCGRWCGPGEATCPARPIPPCAGRRALRHPMTTDADIAARPPLWQRLGLVGGRLAPGLGGFWRWWGLALASWLPARLRALLGLDGRRLLLRHAPGELQVSLERSGQARELARLPLQPGDPADGAAAAMDLPPRLAALPRWLVLPAGAALRRPMV